MRTQAEWKVLTHIFFATGPTSASTRWRISSAALLVKVMARMRKGLTPSSLIRWAMRCVSTRVFPDPAPATTSRGPWPCTTASSWSGFRPSAGTGIVDPSYGRGVTAIREPGSAQRLERRQEIGPVATQFGPVGRGQRLDHRLPAAGERQALAAPILRVRGAHHQVGLRRPVHQLHHGVVLLLQ